MEINPEIANLVGEIARAEGRSEGEVLNDALMLYLRFRESEEAPDLGRPIRRTQRQVPQPRDHGLNDEFQALLYRMSSRFDLDEDEAMSIALEEQRAFRRERSESERTRR